MKTYTHPRVALKALGLEWGAKDAGTRPIYGGKLNLGYVDSWCVRNRKEPLPEGFEYLHLVNHLKWPRASDEEVLKAMSKRKYFDRWDFNNMTFSGYLVKDGSAFRRCSFYRATLRTPVVREARFSNCIFEEAALINCLFHKCTFENCEFVNASVYKTVFAECILYNCTFSGSKCEDIAFNTCTMKDTDFQRSHLLGKTNFDFSAREVSCKWSRAEISDTVLATEVAHVLSFINNNKDWLALREQLLAIAAMSPHFKDLELDEEP